MDRAERRELVPCPPRSACCRTGPGGGGAAPLRRDSLASQWSPSWQCATRSRSWCGYGPAAIMASATPSFIGQHSRVRFTRAVSAGTVSMSAREDPSRVLRPYRLEAWRPANLGFVAKGARLAGRGHTLSSIFQELQPRICAPKKQSIHVANAQRQPGQPEASSGARFAFSPQTDCLTLLISGVGREAPSHVLPAMTTAAADAAAASSPPGPTGRADWPVALPGGIIADGVKLSAILTLGSQRPAGGTSSSTQAKQHPSARPPQATGRRRPTRALLTAARRAPMLPASTRQHRRAKACQRAQGRHDQPSPLKVSLRGPLGHETTDTTTPEAAPPAERPQRDGFKEHSRPSGSQGRHSADGCRLFGRSDEPCRDRLNLP